jgi:rhizosphere induced protein
MSQQYQIVITNSAPVTKGFCVYQQGPTDIITDHNALAWRPTTVAPGSTNTVSWEEKYSFAWGNTPTFHAGSVFTPSQMLDAGLNSNNAVNYNCQNGVYSFSSPSTQSPAGNLYVNIGADVPGGDTAVGVGVDGSPVFAMRVRPGMGYMFTSGNSIWLTTGNYTEGQVLDMSNMQNTVQVSFPAGVYTMYATLNADNTWTLSANQ